MRKFSARELSQISDNDLIRLVQSGYEPAFTCLVLRNQRLVKSMVARYLVQEEEIAEAVQDSFVKAYRFLSDFRGESRFGTWMARIAISTAIDKLRLKRQVTSAIDQNVLSLCAADGSDGFDRLERADKANLLRRAFALMIPEDAQVLRQYYLHERSLEEVCAETGMSVSNAKSRLCRARKRLKAVIERHFQAELADHA